MMKDEEISDPDREFGGQWERRGWEKGEPPRKKGEHQERERESGQKERREEGKPRDKTKWEKKKFGVKSESKPKEKTGFFRRPRGFDTNTVVGSVANEKKK